MIRNAHSARAFVAFLVTWSFVVLTVTGLVLYVVPHGRIANWTFWTLAGLDKEGWANVHILFGAVFIATGALHLWFNWKPFTRYLAERVRGHLALKQESVTSLAATVLLILGALWSVPPVSWLFDLNDWAKAAWARAPGHEPPWPRAEAAPLPVLAERVGLDLDAAIATLQQAGIDPPARNSTLTQLARTHHTTPAALYALLLSEAGPARSPATPTPETPVAARLSGTGLGGLTLAAFADREGMDVETALARLRALGIDARAEERLKVIAERAGLRPIEIAEKLLGPSERPTLGAGSGN